VTDRRQFLAATLATAAGGGASAVRAQGSGGPKVLRIAFPVAETGFDPVQSQDQYSATINAHIFEPPLAYDYLARPARQLPNTLVALPEPDKDFRSFTFRLRPGIFFADDPAFEGKPRELVAADYVYSWKRIADPRWKSQNLYLVENARILGYIELRKAALGGKPFDYDREIEGLRALDRYTFQVRLAAPAPRFTQMLSAEQPFGAVAREVVERYGDRIVEHPVGTGPFRVAHWTRSARIVLERNPSYRERRFDFEAPPGDASLAAQVEKLRGKRLPIVDRVEVAIIEESQPRWLAFLQGKFDALAVPNDYNDLAAPRGVLAPHLARRGIRLQRASEADITVTYFNMEHPMVGGYTPEKVALRRAVALAEDETERINQIFRGNGVIAQSPFVPHTFGYDLGRTTPLSEFNRARAKALLDTYGYVDRNGDGYREQPDGAPLELELASSTNSIDRRQNELWKRSMDAIGVRMRFKVAQWPELLKQSLAGKLMMWGFGWQTSMPDSDTFFGFGYSGNKDQTNDARFALPAYDTLYERSRLLPDGPERLAVLEEATRLIVAYMPYKFHLHRIVNELTQPWLIGRVRHPFSVRWWDYVDVDTALRSGASAEA
jgi:ABC-type transport system substrate-binding protein